MLFIYNWNIGNWQQNELPVDVRTDQNNDWLTVLLSPLVVKYAWFIDFIDGLRQQMRGNSQTFVLQNILNDLFDPTQRRIIIVTASDVLPQVYVYTKAENKPLYVYTAAENKPVYLYTEEEYNSGYDFIVEAAAGSLTAAQIIQLKSTVNKYREAGSRPYYQYLITGQPF